MIIKTYVSKLKFTDMFELSGGAGMEEGRKICKLEICKLQRNFETSLIGINFVDIAKQIQ